MSRSSNCQDRVNWRRSRSSKSTQPGILRDDTANHIIKRRCRLLIEQLTSYRLKVRTKSYQELKGPQCLSRVSTCLTACTSHAGRRL